MDHLCEVIAEDGSRRRRKRATSSSLSGPASFSVVNIDPTFVNTAPEITSLTSVEMYEDGGWRWDNSVFFSSSFIFPYSSSGASSLVKFLLLHCSDINIVSLLSVIQAYQAGVLAGKLRCY